MGRKPPIEWGTRRPRSGGKRGGGYDAPMTSAKAILFPAALQAAGTADSPFEAVALLAAIGDAEMRVLECIAEGNKTALILSLPGSDEVGGSIFHEWSDDGLLLRYQAFTRMPGPPPTSEV